MNNHRDLSRLELERRRLTAAIDLSAGMRQSELARKYGVSRTTASRWARLMRAGDSMRLRKAPGRPCRLTTVQCEELATIYRARPSWTQIQVAQVIHLRFGILYDQDHVGRILKKLGLRVTRKRSAKRKSSGVGTGEPHVSTAVVVAGDGA